MLLPTLNINVSMSSSMYQSTVVEQLPASQKEIEQFGEELAALRRRIIARLGEEDIAHLKKIERRGRISSFIGYALSWTGINPLAAFLIGFGHFTRWLLAHHILHKGYDKVPGIPKRYTSEHFARGKRRWIDWFDWIHPTGWHHEHNILHHYHTGEDADPDLVERHVEFLRNAPLPKIIKRAFVLIAGLTWKYTYYAPNTITVMQSESLKRAKQASLAFLTIKGIFDLRQPTVRALWSRCYLPYGVVHFLVIPLLFSPLGKEAMTAVFINKLLAECFTNLHSFLIIAPNHCGSDLCRYDFHFDTKEEFYVTQVLGTANYATGNDVIDHLHIWLNYQIEHHLFPDIPMLQYQLIQPEIKALCQKYKLPYIQESVFTRFEKMMKVCIGESSMKRITAFSDRSRERMQA